MYHKIILIGEILDSETFVTSFVNIFRLILEQNNIYFEKKLRICPNLKNLEKKCRLLL